MGFITVCAKAVTFGLNESSRLSGKIQVCGLSQVEQEVLMMMESDLVRPTIEVSYSEEDPNTHPVPEHLESPFNIIYPTEHGGLTEAFATLLDKSMKILNLLNKHLGYKLITSTNMTDSTRTNYYWTLQNSNDQ